MHMVKHLQASNPLPSNRSNLFVGAKGQDEGMYVTSLQNMFLQANTATNLKLTH